jgi:hypothetical protein
MPAKLPAGSGPGKEKNISPQRHKVHREVFIIKITNPP